MVYMVLSSSHNGNPSLQWIPTHPYRFGLGYRDISPSTQAADITRIEVDRLASWQKNKTSRGIQDPNCGWTKISTKFQDAVAP